jgi:heptosyltransferase-2
LSGAVERIGYDRYARGCLLTHSLAPPRIGRLLAPISAVDYYLGLAEMVGCGNLSRRVELATTPDEEAAADQVWDKLALYNAPKLVVLNTGGAYGVAKHWPVESFTALARRIVQQWDATVLVLCGPSERMTAAQIVLRAAHPRVTSLANEQLSIGLTKACIRRSTLMVTTDSGPRHLAAAFDIPTVVLFGPTDPRWSVNYNPREVPLRINLPCSPCAKRVCPLRHHDCMQRLSEDIVFNAVCCLMQQPANCPAA